MPNSFTKLYIHHVSAVKNRQALINPEFENRLYDYIVGIIKELNQTPIQVNGMPDHIHIGARLKPSMPPAEFVKKVKTASSKWINANGFLPGKFSWQTGGATFSISETHVEALRSYIKSQKKHHQKQSFKQEYLELLQKNRLDSGLEYLPEFFDDLY